MKECPRCHSLVEEITECPICGEVLTYVDPHPAHREKIARNRYGAAYLGGRLAFPVLCLAAALLIWPWGEGVLPAAVFAAVCGLLSVVLTCFERRVFSHLRSVLRSRDFETDAYRYLRLSALRHGLALLAPLTALMVRLL